MVDLTRQPRLTAGDVLTVLRSRGYSQRPAGGHVLAIRDESRVVVPEPDRVLPPLFTARLEHALAPVLGPGWLTQPSRHAEDEVGWPWDEVMVVEAVVDRCELSGQWCAFLPGEPSIMGSSFERDGALRDVKAAAAAWLGVDTSALVLITPEIL